MIAAWSPAAWSAIAAWVAVVGVGVSLFFAYRQVREAIQLREAQARPFVVVDFEMDSVLIHLTIENTGLLPAEDVHISFDPPMRSTRDDPWPPEKSTLMTTGIPTLPPRKKYRFFIDTFPERLEAGLPLTYEVKVTYRGSGRKAPFEGTNTLDLTFLVGLGEARRKTLHDLASSVEDIAKRLKGWSKGFNGLRVYTVDSETDDRESLIGLAINGVERKTAAGEISDVRAALRDALMNVGEENEPPDRWVTAIEEGRQFRFSGSELDS